MSSPTQFKTGDIFAKDFRVVRPLKAGGMGAVYIVEQVSTGKLRALKVMVPELVNNHEIRERFIREAKVAANIESDHIVETITAGVDDETGSPYLVMELLKGEELADAIDRTGALPVADVNDVLQQIGHALEQAHKVGVVHRDLKPENIYLCVSKRRDVGFTAKVLDFGIAKLVADGMQKTGTQPLGSPLYMSPEQTDRKGKICPATDVWALGLITFTLLTGKSFWVEASGDSLPQLLREVIVDPIPFASKRAAELGVESKLPAGFDAWFAKCVDRNVDARWQDAGECVRAFADIVPADATTKVLKVSTAIVDAAMIAAAKATVANDKTQALSPLSGSTQIPNSPSFTTGAASVSMSDSVSVPAKKSGVPTVAIAGVLAVLLGGGGFYWFGIRGGSDGAKDASTAAATTGASTTSAVSSGAGSTSATTAPLSAPSMVADDPKCPPAMAFEAGGTTTMGAKDLGPLAQPTHEVSLSPYCLDRVEVSVAKYDECVSKGKCEKTPDKVMLPMPNADQNPGKSPDDLNALHDKQELAFKKLCNARKPDRVNHPINCIDWNMAKSYCDFVGKRLPTEAEWEFAARGLGQRDFPWGDEVPDQTHLNAAGSEFVKWTKDEIGEDKQGTMFAGSDEYAGTSPVGTFPKGMTKEGVYDLAGNVWEYTADMWGSYTPAPLKDPTGPTIGTERVIRGGGFNGTDPNWARPAFRYKSDPLNYNHAIGFRCAAAPK